MKKVSPLLLITMLFLLTSCFIPEKFTAEYSIQPNGDFSLVYEGTLINGFSRAATAEAKAKGKTLTQAELAQFDSFAEALKQEPRTKKFNQKNDIYEVRMEEAGNIKSLQKAAFINKDFNFFTLSYNSENNTLTFSTLTLKDADREGLKDLNINIDGLIKITTDCKILAGEENLSKSFFGNTYSLKVNNDTLKNGIQIVMQLQ